MKNPIALYLCLIFMMMSSSVWAQNTLTLTTYYPAPFGAYSQIRLVPQPTLPSPCDPGTMYVNDTDARLYLCRDEGGVGVWDAGSIVWMQEASNVYLTDPAADVFVGIGTETPEFKLSLAQDGGIIANGTFGAGATLTSGGAGARFFWYPRKAAFRAGLVSANQWNDGFVAIGSVAFGADNVAWSLGSSILGGATNQITGAVTREAVIAGGSSNAINDNSVSAAIGGGLNNDVTGSYSTIAGGTNNIINAQNATIAGGIGNQATALSAAVLGGQGNVASNTLAAVGGGMSNTASGQMSFIGSGQSNTASGNFSVISGGQSNQISTDHSFIGGGSSNNVSRQFGTIAGGSGNVVTLDAGFIGAGLNNAVRGSSGAIAGGNNNEVAAVGTSGFIGGGDDNYIDGANSAIAGGDNNRIPSGSFSFIGSGRNNVVDANFSAVPAGDGNNLVGGQHKFAMGSGNTVNGDYSMVFGQSHTLAANAFVFGGTGYNAAANTFNIYPDASGTVFIGGRVGIRTPPNASHALSINGTIYGDLDGPGGGGNGQLMVTYSGGNYYATYAP